MNSDTKISLITAPKDASLKRSGWIQLNGIGLNGHLKMRKANAEWAVYRVRKCGAWPHHMALVKIAMFFMLLEKNHQKDASPLLSCGDIEELLAQILLPSEVSEEEIIFQFEQRH